MKKNLTRTITVLVIALAIIVGSLPVAFAEGVNVDDKQYLNYLQMEINAILNSVENPENLSDENRERLIELRLQQLEFFAEVLIAESRPSGELTDGTHLYLFKADEVTLLINPNYGDTFDITVIDDLGVSGINAMQNTPGDVEMLQLSKEDSYSLTVLLDDLSIPAVE